MAIFSYKARDREGVAVEGEVEARDRMAAVQTLRQRGLVPAAVTERAKAKEHHRRAAGGSGKRFAFKSSRSRMTMRECLLFTGELGDLLSSGMTLGNALNSLARRRAGRVEGAIIVSLRDEVVRGTSFSDAIALHPKTFSTLYMNMIRAGEASGAMGDVMQRLVEHYERVQELREKITMALVYPGIVVTMGIGVLILSMVKVVPQFETIFSAINQQLPLPTRILIGSSRFLQDYGILLAIAIALLAVFVHRAVATKAGQLWWHGVLLKTPMIRGIVASATYANFSRTLATLLGNGVPILTALTIVEKVVDNTVIAREIGRARERVTDGTTISGPLAAGGVLPPMMIDMISIGEETGDMPSALDHIAARYEKELDRNVKIFTTALEPILILGVALMVGFVAVSILMAVFSMTNGMGV